MFTDAEAQDTHRRRSAATAQVARRVRHLARFKDDLAKRVKQLRTNGAPEQRANLRAALAAFSERIGAFPGLGEEIELCGTCSCRRFTIGSPLPYAVWYYYGTVNAQNPVRLAMLMHEDRDRDRFQPRALRVGVTAAKVDGIAR